MKLLFVIEYYFPHVGGVEMFFKKLIDGVLKHGHSVVIVTMRIPGTPAHEIKDNCEIFRISMPSLGSRYWFTISAFFKLLAIGGQFDLIHTTTYNAALPAWIIARLYRKKVIITVHEVWGKLWFSLPGMNKMISFVHWLYERIILLLPFDYYITDAEYTHKRLVKYLKKTACTGTIHLGIDYDHFNPDQFSRAIKQSLQLQDHFVYMYFGRPGWAKGVEYLLQAVPRITSVIPASKLLLVLSKDPPNQYKRIIRMIKKINVRNNVQIINSVSYAELPKYIIGVDCVVFPSLSEGFGFAIAESCALGATVAASNVGSIPEVISGKYFLFKPRDSSSIANAIYHIYKNKEITITPLKYFKWSETINKYLEIYSKFC